MKIYALSTIVDQLTQSERATLYGLREKDRIVVCSLTEESWLENIGIYISDEISSERRNLRAGFLFRDNKLFYEIDRGGGLGSSYQVETINYKTDFSKRTTGIVDPTGLQGKHVTLIGVGSGGSMIAESLVRSGVANITLIDPDEVSVSNLSRSMYDLTDIGMPKTEALCNKLLQINPLANIHTYKEDFLKMDAAKRNEIINDSDLIIEGTDNVKSKLLLNGLAHSTKPILYPGVYDMGKGADLLVIMPGLPCYECVFGSILDEMKKAKKRDWEYSSGQAKPMSSLIADIQVIAARTVKIALAILNSDSSLFEKITEPECTLLMISMTSPVNSGHFRLMLPPVFHRIF